MGQAACPPRVAGYRKDFVTKYMDPTESNARLDQLAAQYPNIAEIVHLPKKTTGYQRRAMAMMAGTTASGSNPNTANQPLAVYLLSKAMGHRRQQHHRRVQEPGREQLADITVTDGRGARSTRDTDATTASARPRRRTRAGALTSTAAQVVAALNADPAAGALVTAYTYAGNAGAGIVPVRAKVRCRTSSTRPPRSSADRSTCA